MDTLTSMAVFARVVEAGGFSRAAEQLDMSRAMVSKHVAYLEERIGVRLLNRTTRHVSLTGAGGEYYERCLQILGDVQAAESAAAAGTAQPRGQLRVNAPVNFGALHLAPAIRDFLRHHPQLSLDLTFTDRIVDLVEEGFDMALRITNQPGPNLIARRLSEVRLVLCAAPAYLQRYGVPRTPEDLRHHNCLGYTYWFSPDEWRLQGPDGEHTVRVSGNVRANNGEALRTLALSGWGLLQAPTYLVADDLRSGRLQPVLPDYRTEPLGLFAVYAARRNLPAKVRLFIDFLAERFTNPPYWDTVDTV
ncbi:MAG TPA: LysR family transcriptional regulator [Gammaproteobacteria bacterium]|nr:LysR family transcriptional regulator [Gammaproteobacteria bacterium]